VMSLAQARETFKRDFAEAIQKGSSIKTAGDGRAGTVADLFDAYVKSLKAAGKPSWRDADKGLNKLPTCWAAIGWHAISVPRTS